VVGLNDEYDDDGRFELAGIGIIITVGIAIVSRYYRIWYCGDDA
jgi:hypothetical protein